MAITIINDDFSIENYNTPQNTQAEYTSGDEFFLEDGTSFVGYYHTMDDGSIMTGKAHLDSSKNLFTLNEIPYTNSNEEINPNTNKLEEDIKRVNETAEFENRHPNLLDMVFQEINEGNYWRNEDFLKKEEYAAVTVTDSISDIPTLRAHIEWLLSPAVNKQNVELRPVNQMGSFEIFEQDDLESTSNTRVYTNQDSTVIENSNSDNTNTPTTGGGSTGGGSGNNSGPLGGGGTPDIPIPGNGDIVIENSNFDQYQ
tara:strand:- start:9582 stop:10349 length:768 start_codon:yes stop_codon:yes gene_type:complete